MFTGRLNALFIPPPVVLRMVMMTVSRRTLEFRSAITGYIYWTIICNRFRVALKARFALAAKEWGVVTATFRNRLPQFLSRILSGPANVFTGAEI